MSRERTRAFIDNVKEHFQHWWKKELSVLAAFGAILGFVSAFGIIPPDVLYFVATVLLSLVISTTWRIIEYKKEKKRSSKTGTDISDREGARRSLALKYIDSSHRITRLLRQDMLDYADGSTQGRDFISFREIEGKNVSKAPTDGFVYLECTEYKCRCKDIKIKAYDLRTNRELRVSFIDRNEEDKYFDFPFKIHFARPLKSGENFAIAYSINLINELDVLKSDGEIMSISLNRYEKGVEELEFNVCLNFEPSSAQVEFKEGDELDEFFLEEGSQVEIKPYTPVSGNEQRFQIEWSSAPYIIRWKCSNLKHDFYAIKYRK